MTKFDQLVAAINSDTVFIQTHNFPDPDAIASAYGLSVLLETRGIKSTIIYSGLIDRANTQKMVNMLNIPLVQVANILPLSPSDRVILVDCQFGNTNVITTGAMSDICVDHHPSTHEGFYSFSDIRPEMGSCTSIVASYFFENDVLINSDVAAALLYGIKIDTANLTRKVSQTDLDMFYKLYPIADNEKLHNIEHNVLEIEDLYAYSSAINSIKITDIFSFAEAPANCPEALIATISDFMLALSDIHLSVVLSNKTDGIRLSVRSDDSALDSGVICTMALNGIGNGGGHASMAGGFVPLNPDTDPNEMIASIEKRFIAAYQHINENIIK